jgi:hypothetical protein
MTIGFLSQHRKCRWVLKTTEVTKDKVERPSEGRYINGTGK